MTNAQIDQYLVSNPNANDIDSNTENQLVDTEIVMINQLKINKLRQNKDKKLIENGKKNHCFEATYAKQ